MASANDVHELEILKKFGHGIDRWARANNDGPSGLEDVVRVGRWNFDQQQRHTVDYDYTEAYRPCDVAVIFGSWKPREKGSHYTRNSVAAQAKCFVVIETPLLNRQTNSPNGSWRVGVNGYLNRDADWAEAAPDVCDSRLQKMGISFSGWNRTYDGHIVVALQLPSDASLRGADINQWAYETIIELRRFTDKEIVIRNHPLVSMRGFEAHNELLKRLVLGNFMQNLRFSDGSQRAWAEDLAGAYCTVTYSSGMAIDSVLAGKPTIACDPGNFAWGISSNSISEINEIKMTDPDHVREWLRRLSVCQFSEDEMYDGTAWNFLQPVVQRYTE